MGYYRGGDNCYGRGDYYRGDYYRGDGFFSKALGAIKGAVGGFIAGGPVGALAGAVRGVVGNQATVGTGVPGTRLVVNSPVAPGSIQTPLTAPFMGGSPAPLMLGPGPGQGPQGAVVLGTSAGASMCTVKGFHLNKSGYFRRTPGGSVIFVEKNSACVRNRRMNPTNGKALRRALRRATAFKKIAMKSIRLLDAGKKPKKFGGFKTKKGR